MQGDETRGCAGAGRGHRRAEPGTVAARLGLQVGLRPEEPRRAADPRARTRAYALNVLAGLLKSRQVWDAAGACRHAGLRHMRRATPGAAIAFRLEQRSGELAWIVDAPVPERELGSAALLAARARAERRRRPIRCRPIWWRCKRRAGPRRRAASGALLERHDHGTAGHRRASGRRRRTRARRGSGSCAPDVLALLPSMSAEPPAFVCAGWSLRASVAPS